MSSWPMIWTVCLLLVMASLLNAQDEGNVLVMSVPVECSLQISNDEMKWYDKTSESWQMALPPGRYMIQCKSGRRTLRQRVQIKAGQQTSVMFNFTLKNLRQIDPNSPTQVALGLLDQAIENNQRGQFAQAWAQISDAKVLWPEDAEIQAVYQQYQLQRDHHIDALWTTAMDADKREDTMLSIEAAKQVVLLDPMHMEARALLSKYNDNTNSLGMKMQLIPTGSFKQGSPINARQISHRYGMDQKYFKEEVPQFPVQITKPFYMSATLVTRGQFARFIHQTGYQTSAQKDKNKTAELNAVNLPGVKRGLTWLEPGFEQQDDHPVVVVSWDDASAFCAWLSEREGRTYHMPTESQWEYACRAGSSTAYWWGDTMQEGQGKANVCDMSTAAWMIDHFGKEPANYEHWDDGYANTSPVGSFAANPWGLYDLHGNVSEWCDSVFESYQSQLVTTTNPIKPPATVRVIRGGSWGSAAAMNRSTYRVRFATVWATNYTGFRVVSESP